MEGEIAEKEKFIRYFENAINIYSKSYQSLKSINGIGYTDYLIKDLNNIINNKNTVILNITKILKKLISNFTKMRVPANTNLKKLSTENLRSEKIYKVKSYFNYSSKSTFTLNEFINYYLPVLQIENNYFTFGYIIKKNEIIISFKTKERKITDDKIFNYIAELFTKMSEYPENSQIASRIYNLILGILRASHSNEVKNLLEAFENGPLINKQVDKTVINSNEVKNAINNTIINSLDNIEVKNIENKPIIVSDQPIIKNINPVGVELAVSGTGNTFIIPNPNIIANPIDNDDYEDPYEQIEVVEWVQYSDRRISNNDINETIDDIMNYIDAETNTNNLVLDTSYFSSLVSNWYGSVSVSAVLIFDILKSNFVLRTFGDRFLINLSQTLQVMLTDILLGYSSIPGIYKTIRAVFYTPLGEGTDIIIESIQNIGTDFVIQPIENIIGYFDIENNDIENNVDDDDDYKNNNGQNDGSEESVEKVAKDIENTSSIKKYLKLINKKILDLINFFLNGFNYVYDGISISIERIGDIIPINVIRDTFNYLLEKGYATIEIIVNMAAFFIDKLIYYTPNSIKIFVSLCLLPMFICFIAYSLNILYIVSDDIYNKICGDMGSYKDMIVDIIKGTVKLGTGLTKIASDSINFISDNLLPLLLIGGATTLYLIYSKKI